jgi:putative exporter of polyketide antibiotics
MRLLLCALLALGVLAVAMKKSIAANNDTIQCLTYDNQTTFAVRMFGKTGYGKINDGDWIPASLQWGNPSGFILSIFSFVTPSGFNVTITTTVKESDSSAIGMLEFYKIGSSNVTRLQGKCVFTG